MPHYGEREVFVIEFNVYSIGVFRDIITYYSTVFGINFSIAADDVEALYEAVKQAGIEIYRPLTKSIYQVNGIDEAQIEFLIQDPNGYLLRFTN